jgi:ribonuclease HI
MSDKAFTDTIVIFCDGACSGNPGPGGWGSIVATPDGRVKELGGKILATTNNRMELTAVIEALAFVRASLSPLALCTDSTYVIRGMTQWIFGWRKKGWKTAEGKDVANKDLWEELSSLVGARGKGNIDWKYVRGHTGIAGNERCDEIAVSFSKGEHVFLYSGPLLKYEVPIYDIPENTAIPEMKDKSEPKAKAYSYLSLLGGVPMRHETWSECERRVKGQSGAKFKKSVSVSDEIEILKAWGISPENLSGK